MPNALLLVLCEIDAAYEEELNAWYDDEHMAERLSIPGFVSARRWLSCTAPRRYLSTYELTSLEVLRSAGYLAHYGDNQTPWSKRMLGKVRVFRRWTAKRIAGAAEPGDGAALFLSARDCPAPLDAEFNRWYDTEHLPSLTRLPGVLAARRFRASVGAPPYLALYDLAEPDLPTTPAWAASVETPWARRLLPQLAAAESFHDRFVAYPKEFTAQGPRPARAR